MSKEKNTALAVPSSNSNLPTFYTPGDQVDTKKLKLKVLSLPPIIKPADLPLGACLIGTLLAVADSPKKEFKSRILTFEQTYGDNAGRKYAFPETAVIRQALESEGGAEKLIGRVIAIKAMGTKPSGKGKRDMRLFEVAISET